MDYDRYDAFLHHIFKQTQGDAWFRPNEEHISAGVALRINDTPEFRVFPYENISLEPFESAIAALNPVVAVKVRSAAVHAALADVPPEQTRINVDADTRIQIFDTMNLLPQADREQCAAFVRDERVLVVWSDSLEAIIPTCNDIESRLIKLLWNSRPSNASNPFNTPPGSVTGHSTSQHDSLNPASRPTTAADFFSQRNSFTRTDEKSTELPKPPVYRRTWYGRKYQVKDEEGFPPDYRPTRLYAPFYNGLAAALSLLFVGIGVSRLLREFLLDGQFLRFALVATVPLLCGVSLFFCLQIVQNIAMAFGPIAQCHENSKYFSAVKPRPNKLVDNNLPHITIQMPVYKESLDTVLAPSIESIKKAMQTYARQGGTSAIFVNDDGLRLLSPMEREKRLTFYANHGIGWVARPKHDSGPNGFHRAGRFKKASNMNYALDLSLKVEKHLDILQSTVAPNPPFRRSNSSSQHSSSHGSDPNQHENASTIGFGHGLYGMQYAAKNGGGIDADGNDIGAAAGDNWRASEDDLEERALELATEEVYDESGRRFKPWAANGRAMRLGEYILLVDCDTKVPEDCLRDAAREMEECETVAIIQHESDVLQVAHHYFENGIAYFTRRINRCITLTCANGEVAPFVGHNAFLRWKAIQDAAFVDPADRKEKIWSEANVSEDFDMSLRLQMRGYIVRWATYCDGEFKEGVSLSVDDELNRWQKYAYGCNELLFNPLIQWWRRGPIAHQIHRFIWSSAPLHYKLSMMAYMFSYYGIAAAMTIGIINYILLGFQLPVDGFYLHSFEIWLATVVVFFGSGTIGFTLLEYRLGKQGLLKGLWTNLAWIPFFFFFFGGLSIPLTQAVLAHLFSYNITWSATVKEVRRSNFFKEVPKIVKRFWFPLLVSWIVIAGMIVCATPLVPLEWRVDVSGWAVIFPLALQAGCHILFPIVLNPWLMIFSY